MRALVVTNDLPPRAGGIQTYVHELLRRQPKDSVVVLGSSWRGSPEFDRAASYDIVRMPTSVLLPTPGVIRRAGQIADTHGCDSVWFPSLVPLGLMAPALRRRTGIGRAVAATHGHEVGWARTPGARQLLRHAATQMDVVTVLGAWTQGQLVGVLGGTTVQRLPGGVDTTVFRADPAARSQIRRRHGIGEDQPVVVCVSRLMPRKGQDSLIRALPALRRAVPGAALLLVGGGPSRKRLKALADSENVTDAVIFTGSVPSGELPAHYAAGDVFAMPCRSRLAGIDVEGLGLVYLEAAAVGLPVVTGRSGGAPEAVIEGVTGHTVDGRSSEELVRVLAALLLDPARAAALGAAGAKWVRREWDWSVLAPRLTELLSDQSPGLPE